MSYAAPFAGLKVVDLSQGIAAPYCAMLLAQYGADVIKVEPIEGGDWSRVLGKPFGDHTPYSIAGNLGKRSIALDLKSADGKAVLWRLLAGADVFLESFRPGVIRRLGFDYPSVSAREPRVIYLSVSGFGQTGPLAERPAMDPVLQAYTGLMVENQGADGVPHRVPVIAIDMSTALYAFQALSAALYGRRDEPRGRYIETSLMQSAAAFQSIRMIATHLEGNSVAAPRPPSGVYRTADGWISITVARENEWVAYCGAIDRPALAADPRFADRHLRLPNAAALDAIVRPMIEAKPDTHWAERFTAAKVMYERLNNYAEFFAQPQVAATGLMAQLTQPGVPVPVPYANLAGMAPFVDGTPLATAPNNGEHTEAILREHGFSPAEIGDFRKRRVIGPHASTSSA